MSIAAKKFESIGFAFREQPICDFGIDAHIELRSGARGSGQLIALQIKSGDSYFRNEAPNGWWLSADQEHATYWLQHSLPVVIVLVDVRQEVVFWELASEKSVAPTGSGTKQGNCTPLLTGIPLHQLQRAA